MSDKVPLITLGAETNTTYSFFKDDKLHTSSLYTDLKDPEVYSRYTRDILQRIQKDRIKTLVCDMHPDYLSTQFAQSFLIKHPECSIQPVQHHFAHIHSVLFEHQLNDDVLAFTFDGTGYGLDGHSWGGEVFIYDKNNYRRIFHLQYLPQPGGDTAVKEPWRMALSWLKAAIPEKDLLLLPFSRRIGENKISSVLELMDKKINMPLTSSAGRLFDSVASILGLCDYAEFPAQGPLLLEKVADTSVKKTYGYEITNDEIIFLPVIRCIINDLNDKTAVSEISAKFHNTLAFIIYQTAEKLSQEYSINKAVFSGGCFLNKFLCSRIKEYFLGTGISIYFNEKFPASDRNISVGQAFYAIQQLSPSSALKHIS